MTLLEAIQHDLNNGPTRESIKNNVPFKDYASEARCNEYVPDDLEAAFSLIDATLEKK
jgi:hypothetical protein